MVRAPGPIPLPPPPQKSHVIKKFVIILVRFCKHIFSLVTLYVKLSLKLFTKMGIVAVQLLPERQTLNQVFETALGNEGLIGELTLVCVIAVSCCYISTRLD